VEVLFGGLTSILYGVADFLGGEGAKRVPAASIVLWAGIFSFPVVLIVALLVGGEAGPRDYLIGAGAGVAGAFGLVMLFAGLGKGHAAAVAPVSAALAAVVPVVGSVLGGERPSTLTWIGVAVAVPAIVLCAWVADPDETLGNGFLYGLAAGLGFGGFAVIIRYTSPSSNLLPLIASRGATMLIVLALTGVGVWKSVGFKMVPRPLVASSGLLDVAGNVSLLLALRAGSVAAAAVSASFYPVVTVALARFVNAETLRTRQFVGLGLALTAMVAIAVG
jgi:drug/metabolite transporter (DMT)-like permease